MTAVTSPRTSVEVRGHMTAKQRRRALLGYAFLSPWLFGFLAFTAIPIVGSMFLSFTKYSVMRPPSWIGLQNYQHALLGGDKLVWLSIYHSFYYAWVSVPLGLVGSLFWAVILKPFCVRAAGCPAYQRHTRSIGAVALAPRRGRPQARRTRLFRLSNAMPLQVRRSGARP